MSFVKSPPKYFVNAGYRFSSLMLTVLSLFSLAQVVIPGTPSPPTNPVPLIQTPPPVVAPTGQPALPTAPGVQPASPPQPLAPPPPRQVELLRSQEVRPLPGQLDDVPMFNSNSPEVIQNPGILLSTFPTTGMQVPSAHLDYAFNGRFDIFAHHIAKGIDPIDNRTLYMAIVVYNHGDQPVTLNILQAVSYLSQDAPFVNLPSYVSNATSNVFAGPGSRTTGDLLRGQRQSQWPAQVTIPPKRIQLLVNVPIPLRRLTVPTDGTLPPGFIIPAPVTTAQAANGDLVANVSGAAPATAPRNRPAPPVDRDISINGRTLQMQLSSSAPVYVASLAMYAPQVEGGAERVPTLSEWVDLLTKSGVAGPRDRPPSPPETRSFVRYYYSRVAGVSQGSEWRTTVTDKPDVDHLTIPEAGQGISYVLSTVDRNTFGTGQVQSAPMLVRYPDTAYRAHGNYGVRYNLSLPLYNDSDETRRVALMVQTPVRNEENTALKFRNPPDNLVFFRGTVRLRYTNDFGIPQTRYTHLVQRRGEEGQPLLELTLPKGDRRLVQVEFLYPPDATPPQVLTIETLDDRSFAGTSSTTEAGQLATP
ncbi:DUF3370 domain-containing protein [Phormidium tenue FACHB-886]|nr:DUF3370 domain-containing protein [Phormidium tenue FACHB-886]